MPRTQARKGKRLGHAMPIDGMDEGGGKGGKTPHSCSFFDRYTIQDGYSELLVTGFCSVLLCFGFPKLIFFVQSAVKKKRNVHSIQCCVIAPVVGLTFHFPLSSYTRN